jgi:hypothetical protein
MRKNPLDGLKTKTIMVPVANIETNTFVRSGIDHNRIELMGIAVEGGAKLPPVILFPAYELNSKGEISSLCNDTFFMVDGRHRLFLEDQMFDSDKIAAQIILGGIKTEAELISLAFLLNNPDGPMPPDKYDIEHTVEELLKRKVPKKEIPAMLGLPDAVVKKFVNDVEQRLEHAKTLRAYKHVVNKGMSIPEAAQREDTTPEKVRNYIAAGRRKRKASDVESASRTISGSYKSLNSTLHMTVRILVGKYDDGDVSGDDILGILEKVEGFHTRNAKSIKDLRARFEAKLNGKL